MDRIFKPKDKIKSKDGIYSGEVYSITTTKEGVHKACLFCVINDKPYYGWFDESELELEKE
jgi:hypothetical protein